MENLTHLILEAVDDGTWKSIKASRYGPKISHLMFVDNLLLFGQSFVKKMQVVKRILDNFCGMSWQRINFEKSTIIFSKNTTTSCRNQMLQKAGMKEL